MSEAVDDIAAAEAARAQAEARRQRILEKANRRMGVVSGEQTMEKEEKEASEAKAARIRAARQRRYGKKTTTPNEATKEAIEKPEAKPAEEPKEEPEEVKTVATAASEKSSENVSWPEDEKPTPEEGASNEDDGSKKKYLGVARMRRNALKKKKDAGDSQTSSATADVANLEAVMNPIKVSKLPIYMHIVTILLLFLAGLDVSLQNYHPAVHSEATFAIVQHGVPIIHRSLGPVAVSEKAAPLDQTDILPLDDTVDEFEEDSEKASNVDPVFGVDLDEVTQGPGIMNQLARGAVGAHRTILYFIYYLPMNLMSSFAGIPQALMRSPPALCIIALILRHVVGKAILGARLPDMANANDKGIDVLAMAKNFVTKFLSTSFPTAIIAYDAFTHLRSDMYVVLCGVFTGLIYVHMTTTTRVLESGGVDYVGTDEL